MDLGGTKLSAAIFTDEGSILSETTVRLDDRKGNDVGRLITEVAGKLVGSYTDAHGRIRGIGICVPGIYHASSGRVWAPNISGWDDYPLLEVLSAAFKNENISVNIDSDRACSILGETWKGIALNSRNAIFMAVGTGIGAGILCDGRIIRGHADIAGSVGWMALTPHFHEKYKNCGCFEYHASGEGLVKTANDLLAGLEVYNSSSPKSPFTSAMQVFEAYENDDPVARDVLNQAVTFWGMAAANLISIFNPEIIVFGGGVFGPAKRFLDQIKKEASKWAQPISMGRVRFEVSGLGGNTGLVGAGKLALMTAESQLD